MKNKYKSLKRKPKKPEDEVYIMKSNSWSTNVPYSKTTGMRLSNFLKRFLPKDTPEAKSLERFIQKMGIPNCEIIPEKIVQVFQKIKNSSVLEQNDIDILEEELKKIRHINFHDAIVCVLHILGNQIYRKYKQKIADAQAEIENYYFEGKKLPNAETCEDYNRGDYNDLLNFQRIRIPNYKNDNNGNISTGQLYFKEHIGKDERRDAILGINALITLGKIPESIVRSVQFEPEAEELDELLNSKNKNENNKRCLIFAKKNSNKKQYGDTFLATDGEKISYATKSKGEWFIASHRANDIIDNLYLPEASKIHSSKKITTYLNSNQDYWNAFSNYAIDSASKLFIDSKSPYRDLEYVLRFLGEKRQIVAQQLNHGRVDGRTGEFGRLRYGKKFSSETVDEEKPWPDLYPKVKARIEALKDRFISQKSIYCHRYYYPEGSKHFNYYDKNFRIEFSSSNPHYLLKYPHIKDQQEFTEICKKLKPLLDTLFNWDGQDINEFTKDIGRISYELYRLLPFCLGTSAIVSWLMRSVAHYKGIELGPLKEDKDDLPLDWQAFLTFDREEYANWFLSHAYKEVTFIGDQKNLAGKIKTEQGSLLLSLFDDPKKHQSVNKKSISSPNNLSDGINLLTTSVKNLLVKRVN